MRKLFVTSILASALSLAGCSSEDSAPEAGSDTVYIYSDGDTWEPSEPLPDARKDYEAIGLTSDQMNTVDAGNDFALSIFRNISKSETSNSLLSPLSLSLNLGLLANGALGDTYAELAHMTGANPNRGDVDGLGNLNSVLIDGLLSADKSCRISIANSIWIESGFDVLDDFVRNSTDSYRAGIYRRNLDEQSITNEVNSWVGKNTNGVISKLIDRPFSADTRIALANALYFYGSWVHSFDKTLTHKASFSCIDGTVSEVDMMTYSENVVDVAHNDLFRAAILPFGNGAFNIAFILPAKGVSLESAEAAVSAKELRRLESSKRPDCVPLCLPKFEVESDIRLKESIKALGYESIFDTTADFGNINHLTPLWVDDIMQKAVVKIDEEGAEGAAATLTIMDTSAGPDASMIFDRPFIFAIYERSSGAILFVGDVKAL